MLRLAIAPCVETIILLDRLFYLKEHGTSSNTIIDWFNKFLFCSSTIGCNATMMPLFDPSISPRNFVIIAHKE